MIKKVDHLTFAVKDVVAAGKRLQEVYGAEFLMSVESKEGQYRCDAYMFGQDMIIGFLESTSPDGFVAKHIEKFGESLQHIGVDVDDLDQAMQKLAANDIKFTEPKEMQGVKREVIVGAKSAFGAITQIQEWLGEFKTADSRKRMLAAWIE